jgi:predicted CXXCH cytochrome family protein
MPPAEQYCREYHESKLVEESESAKKKQESVLVGKASVHPPYAEKQCDGCHDKNKQDGLIAPRAQLCFICHPDIIKKAFVHGPAATGSCLECHEPHSTPNEALLKTDKVVLCAVCHREKRLAAAMHDSVAAKGMICTDCHDPHGGASPVFLK